jgi:hypothetical protein
MRRSEAGAALVAVVMITLALFAIGHGLFGLALGERAASRAAIRLLESSAAAESSVHLALTAGGAAWMDSVAAGGAPRVVIDRPFGRAWGSAAAWRLSREAWWVEGRGRVGRTEARIARLAWAMDPLARVRALDAAVTVALGSPVAIAGSVEVAAPASVDAPLDPSDCNPWLVELAAHYAEEPLAPVVMSADTLPSLGMLSFYDLLASADASVTGSVSPAPVESAGTCVVGAPSNWGDPERPWRPCGAHFALRSSVGSLLVDGGAGQGVLVVDGDVVLEGGARFYGLVLARGALHVEDGAQLVGMATATGGVYVAAGGLVRASACWVARTLAAHRADLSGLRAMPGMGRLGPL